MAQVEKDIYKWLVKSGLSKANFWETLADNKVKCHLCPRKCILKPDNFGFCNSRYNLNGTLKTAIWGKMLTPSIEPIETEAVFHFWPGAKILSLGNIGCNLECDFCQNWESSNLQNLRQKFVRYYTSEEIIKLAKTMGIKVISFTYNDPAIWFEFVYETAKLARQNGIKTLFKSAGFISTQPAEYLTKVIDIFSISIKSINPQTFKSMSKGNLDDVLEATKIFYKSKKHLEISNLVVTELTDVEEDVIQLARWIKQELSSEVPLHFVRFHPAHRYTGVKRTPIAFLIHAREIARKEGMKYVYIGNTYDDNHANIHCDVCGKVMIRRFGLHTQLHGILPDGTCSGCRTRQTIVLQPEIKNQEPLAESVRLNNHCVWKWLNSDSRNLHMVINNTTDKASVLLCEHMNKSGIIIDREITRIPANCEIRYAFGQKEVDEEMIHVSSSDNLEFYPVELLDRAHFPLGDTCIQR
jgi:pyruvate formate lyase activating enzyme